LRSDGLLLIFQPSTAYKIVELTVDESVLFKDEIEEPNFMQYLLATHITIQNVLADGAFIKEQEETTPMDGTYNYHEFESVDHWAKEYSWLSDDPDALALLATKLRALVNERAHHVRLHSQDYELLLRKG